MSEQRKGEGRMGKGDERENGRRCADERDKREREVKWRSWEKGR